MPVWPAYMAGLFLFRDAHARSREPAYANDHFHRRVQLLLRCRKGRAAQVVEPGEVLQAPAPPRRYPADSLLHVDGDWPHPSEPTSLPAGLGDAAPAQRRTWQLQGEAGLLN